MQMPYKEKEKKAAYMKQYCEANKEANKEKKAAYMKQYCEANKLTNRPKRMISDSKRADIKYNRYDPINYITEAFICTTFDNQNCLCYHCGRQIAFDAEILANHLATIERLDNAIGHIQSNCVLACLSCNLKRGTKKLDDFFVN